MLCKNCSSSFEITDQDRDFYQKMQVPEPTWCHPCRQQRRKVHVNQMNLYKRTCDATGKEIISVFSPDKNLKVFNQEYWYSDAYDGTKYGRDFDFSRPFFEQFAELAKEVPRVALFTGFQYDENSAYTNQAGKNKNCYLIFDSDYNQDCYYGLGINKSKNCVDNNRIKECELCFECIDCFDSYQLYYSQDCTNCTESAFLKNCIGCKNCFMCSNLKNKQYYIFNKPYDKATYEKLMNSLSKHSELEKYFRDWSEFKVRFPQKFIHGVQNENVTGDYLINCKNSVECFDSMELWDCKYHTRAFGSCKDCMDCDEVGDAVELAYEVTNAGYNLQNIKFSGLCLSELSDIEYSLYCFHSHHLFGCHGLNRKSYCILNKQYSKEEYENLVTKIIEHMKKTGEYGQFFPASLSDFGYNETLAEEYYPLNKEQALAAGYQWRDKDQKEYQLAAATVPDDSKAVNKNFCNELLACIDCGRNYKIIEQELNFYQNQGLAIPKKCFYCRHLNRFNLRNTRQLFSRNCANCSADIQTTYSPDRSEKVLCENCYLKTVY